VPSQLLGPWCGRGWLLLFVRVTFLGSSRLSWGPLECSIIWVPSHDSEEIPYTPAFCWNPLILTVKSPSGVLQDSSGGIIFHGVHLGKTNILFLFSSLTSWAVSVFCPWTCAGKKRAPNCVSSYSWGRMSGSSTNSSIPYFGSCLRFLHLSKHLAGEEGNPSHLILSPNLFGCFSWEYHCTPWNWHKVKLQHSLPS
jgi:hypothetical protein